MFGYPAAFAHGNMVCGLFRDSVVVRLGKEGSAEVIDYALTLPRKPATVKRKRKR